MRHNALTIKICLFIGIFINIDFNTAQNVVNNGNSLVISSGAYIIIGGNYINKTSTDNGKIDIDDTILLVGDFENYALNEVFVNQEAIPNGTVIMRNTNVPQSIKGDQPSRFENLNVLGKYKILEASNSGVKGILTLNAIFKLNQNNFILYNETNSAINYIDKYILSETNSIEGYGTLDWRIGSNISQYEIPFGSGETDFPDLNVTYISHEPGSPSTAGIKFATYPSIDRDNLPLPISVFSLDPYNSVNIADRYWITNADEYNSKPVSSLTFKYRNHDIEQGNAIIESKLKAIRTSDGDIAWDGVLPAGIVNADNNSMSILNIPPVDWRTNWTMTSIEEDGEFWVPQAFTPNNDAGNDVFIPVFGFVPKNYHLDIYDRWGERLFSSVNYKNGWTGIYKSKLAKQDVYVWKIAMVRPDGKEYHYQGHFSLVLWQ